MVEEFSYQKHVMSFFSCIDDLRSVRSGQMANYNLTRVRGKICTLLLGGYTEVQSPFSSLFARGYS